MTPALLSLLLVVASVAEGRRAERADGGVGGTWKGRAAGGWDADEVRALPGWDAALPTRMWSGYLPSLQGMHSHYVMAECTEGEKAACPTVAWFQGGPGASGMFGMFVEIGPLVVRGYPDQGKPVLHQNDFAWTEFAHVLVIDSPPPVGYSYCDASGPSGNGTSCGDWDDERTARANDAALRAWAKRFPEHASTGVIIAGESYAGVYVPTLLKQLVTDADPPPFRIVGAAVGDPCAPPAVCGVANAPLFQVLFAHGHGAMSLVSFNAIMSACGGLEGLARLDAATAFPGCGAALEAAARDEGRVYPYAEYDDCSHAGDPFRGRNLPRADARDAWWTATPRAQRWFGGRPAIPLHASPPPPPFQPYPGGVASGGAPCGSLRSLGVFLALPETKAALNVPADSYFFECDNGRGFNYTLSEKDVLTIWSKLATTHPILVYNGDTDPGLNFMVTQNWTSHIAGLVEREKWRPWTIDGKQRLGGFVTRYLGSSGGRLDYATVHGSGHMVPQYKPVHASAMIQQWLADRFAPPPRRRA